MSEDIFKGVKSMTLLKIISTGKPYPEWFTITGVTVLNSGRYTDYGREKYLQDMKYEFYKTRALIQIQERRKRQAPHIRRIVSILLRSLALSVLSALLELPLLFFLPRLPFWWPALPFLCGLGISCIYYLIIVAYSVIKFWNDDE